ncbi:VIT1/CCC1 transporter family protein [Imbroritus primus]|uniref:VIT1/CCC1 transporter family protein n=1 Tax=Imbroritus primus TaxID=3058603 RepID=UPI003D160F94
MPRPEHHRINHVGWLRAAVLGANDGIISTASLVVGIAATGATRSAVLVAGVAALVAGAMSMAAGEYVSVRSQADTEAADLLLELQAIKHNRPAELDELAEIYVARGLQPELAHEVARQLMAHDALGAHARDELGITDQLAARPVQAAFASAATFSAGALVPLLIALLAPPTYTGTAVTAGALLSLTGLGALAARVGGAPVVSGAVRVTLWGAGAMGLTALVGRLFGATI